MYAINWYESYLAEVTEALERHRAYFLGQFRRLEDLLPGTLRLTTAQMAKRITQVLLFLLVRIEALEEKILQQYQNWLELVCIFLLESCPEEDHTCYSILKICALEPDVFFELVRDEISTEVRHTLLHPPDGLLAYLEEAVWYLMEPSEKKEKLTMLQELKKG